MLQEDRRAVDRIGPPPTTLPRKRVRLVALVGPPNSGKSTLFNRLTGLRQKVGNFPGVTVERRVGRASVEGNREVHVIDLPGIYSLTPQSEDERVTLDVLKGTRAEFPVRMPSFSFWTRPT